MRNTGKASVRGLPGSAETTQHNGNEQPNGGVYGKPVSKGRVLQPDQKLEGLFWLDSGAFSLLSQVKAAPQEFYNSKEFYNYLDEYAAFVKQYADCIDYYANVDAINHPDLTWRNQQYLEDKGLKPVPVVHYTNGDLKWLQHYLDRGYDYIGLGGLVGNSGKDACRRWVDRCFNMVCDNPKHLPSVRMHGFGVTSYEFIIRYPWWSVDSATWTKVGAQGGILIPQKRQGKYTFGEEPYQMSVSTDSPNAKKTGKHYFTLAKAEQAIVREWLEIIEVPLGKGTVMKGTMEPETPGAEPGVVNHHSFRKVANLLFYEGLREWLDIEKGPYPWPFTARVKKGWFGC